MKKSRASALSPACPAESSAAARRTAPKQRELLVFLLLFPAAAILAQSTNVVTWRYDNTHEGANTSETILTPTNVNTNTFGKLFSQPVNGQVYAQPLYISNLTMPNNTVHNVLFVATEHDSLYAFDADTNGGSNGSPLWQANLIDTAHGAAPGATTVPSSDVQSGPGDITPEIGVTSTPVIDPSTQTLFVVSKSEENGNYVQRLHAINILNGNEQSGSPVEISASTPGTGNGSSGGTLNFSELWELNRPALDLFNGNIYLAFGSHADNGPWHGWLLVYNEATLQQSAALCFSPNGNGDAIWMSGEGPPIDTVSANGRMFVATGNGDLTSYPPITSSVDYGESVLRLDLSSGGATPVDAFTDYDQATLSANDLDLGSGGVLILPDQSGAYPHILIQVGKDGEILVINRDNLGGYAPGGTSNTNILQDISGALTSGNGLWSTPAYWNGYVYMWARYDSLKQFTLTNGVLATQPSSTSAISSGFPGVTPVVSSNGTQTGIVWALVTDLYNSNGSSILYAFDALNLGSTLYASDQNPARDDAGPAIKFTVPAITNGKVYVGAGYQIDVYGLLDSEPQTPAPAISPGGGNFLTSQGVTITDTASGASIYYTTDGSTPTVASTLYTGPITISAGTTLQAIASVNGSLQSPVASATFTFSTQTTPPEFAPAAGNYSSAQTVTLTDSTAGAVIYYTTNGSTPTTGSSVYSSPIPVSASTTINAFATASGFTPSAVTSAAYTFNPYLGTDSYSTAGTDTANYINATYAVTGTASGGYTVSSCSFYQPTGTVTAGAKIDCGVVLAPTPTTQSSTWLCHATYTNPSAAGTGGWITIPLSGCGTLPAGTAYWVATDSNDPLQFPYGFWNCGGTCIGGAPTQGTGSYSYSYVAAPYGVYSGMNTAMIIATGYQAAQYVTLGANSASVTATPAFSPGAGNYTSTQSVTISDATPGAVIYYTTDGSTPTTGSPIYSSPLSVSANTTINAMATAAGYTGSEIGSATYTFNPYLGTNSYSTAGTDTANYINATYAVTGTASGGYTVSSCSFYQPTGTVTAGAKIDCGLVLAPTPTTQSSAWLCHATYTNPSASGTGGWITLTLSGCGTLPAGTAYWVATDNNDPLQFPYGFWNCGGTCNGSAPTQGAGSYPYSYIAAPYGVYSGMNTAMLPTTGYQAAQYVTLTSNSASVAATPAFSPGAGNYTSTQSVTISDATPGAVIYYTTDGSTPTTGSPIYSSPLSVSANTTINAMATAAGYTGSEIGSATYTFNPYLGTNSYSTAGTDTANYINATYAVTGTASGGYTVSSCSFYQPTGTVTAGAKIDCGLVLAPTPTTQSSAWLCHATYTNPSASGTGGWITLTLSGCGTLPAGTAYWVATDNNDPLQFPYGFWNCGGTCNGSAPTQGAGSYPYSYIAAPYGVYSGMNTAMLPTTGDQAAQYVTLISNSASVAETPVFSPVPGTYTSAQSVTISDATPGAVIYYTTDGSTPTTSSAVYTAPIAVSEASLTLQALAAASGYQNSTVVSGVYQIQSASTVTANPEFSPGSGTYSSSQSVTITDATPGAVIYYTTNGSTPTTTSAVYSSPIAIAANAELQAMAVAPGSSPSAVVTASYVIQVAAGGSINFSTGFASATGLQFNGASKVNSNNFLELTDGGANEAASTFWTTPVNIQSFSTTFAFQLTQATANGFTFTIQNVAANAIGGDGGGLGYGPSASGTPAGIASSVAVKFDIYNTAGEGTDSTGLYTDGASPTVPAVDITPSGIELDSGDLILAQITYNGTTLTLDLTDAVSGKVFTDSFPVNIPSVVGSSAAYVGFTASTGTATAVQNILNWVFTSGGQLTAGDPAFNPSPGVYSTAQNVTLTSATPGATIYYTVDGSTPSTSSPIYSAPIVVSGASLSIRAFAAASGYQSSPVVVGDYQIQSGSTVTANPVFTPGSGTYSSPQSVAISDATPGAVVYYTTDGSTPTTGSSVYSSPIPVSASTTINAFATASGFTPSAVTSAAYTFNPYLGTDSYSTAGTDTANYINATYAVTGTASGGYTVSSCSFYQPTGTVTAGAKIDCGLVLAPTPTTQSSTWLCHATYTNPSAAGTGGWITLTLSGCGTLPAGTAYWVATDNNDPLQFPYGFWNCGGTCNGSAPTQGAGSYPYSYIAAPYGVYSGMNTAMLPTTGYQAAQYVTLTSNSASVAATPAFSPGAGNYTSTQSVTISDATPGAVIYYTTDGSTPTTGSPIYSSPLSVSANTTINAMATAAGYTGSEIGSATYTFNPYLGTNSYSTAGTDTANYINATYAVTGTASGGYTVSSCSFYQPTGTVTAGAKIDCGLVLAPTPTTQSSAWLCHATYTNPSAAGTGGWITLSLSGCGTLPAGTAYWVATDNNDPLQFPYGFWNCGGTCNGSAPTQGAGSYPYSYIAAPYGVYSGMNTAMLPTTGYQAAQYVTLISGP